MKTRVGLWAVGLGLGMAAGAWGAERFVAQNGQAPSSPYTNWSTAASNIQDAITAAANYDTITVGPGRYTGSNTFEGAANVFYTYDKPLTFRSSAGAAATLIDGQGATRGAWMGTDNPSRTGPYIFDGFTVSNCYTTNKSAGVRLYTGNLSLTGYVQNCVITHCTSTDTADGAGGIRGGNVGGDHLLVVSNTVVRNCAGAGIFMYNYNAASVSLLTHCRIEQNSGSGVYLSGWGGNHYVWNSVIMGNTSSGSGGGLACYNMPVHLRNCLVARNRSENNTGGALFLSGHLGHTLENCTIVSNACPLRWYSGAGVGIHWSGGVTAWNTICVSNRTDNGYTEDFVGSVIACTNVCTSTFYSPGVTQAPMAGANNIAADPLFVDGPADNYRLQAASPCANAGTNLPWVSGALDLDGRRRTDKFSGLVDMGAYERQPAGVLLGSR